MELASEPELRLNIYTADPHTPTADGLKLLGSWAATRAVDSTGTQDARGLRAPSPRAGPVGAVGAGGRALPSVDLRDLPHLRWLKAILMDP